MRFLYFILLSFLFSIAAYGASENVRDSVFVNQLKQIKKKGIKQPEIAIKKLDSLRLNTSHLTVFQKMKLNQLYGTFYYYNNNFDEAKKHFKSAISEASKAKDSVSLGKINNNLGVLHSAYGKYDSAIVYFDRSLVFKRRLKAKKGVGSTFMNIANVYNRKGFYSTASKYYYKALEIFNQLHTVFEEATTLNNIGTCQKKLGKYREAYKVYKKAYQLFDSIDKPIGKHTALNNIGSVQMALKEYDKATITLKSILNSPDLSNDSLLLAFAYFNLGQIAIKHEKWKEADKYISQSIGIFNPRSYRPKKLLAISCKGLILYHLNQPQKGLSLLDSAFTTSLNIKAYPLALKTGLKYAYTLQKENRFEKAATVFDKVRKIQLNIYNEKQARITEDIETRYKIEKRKRKLQLIKKQKEVLQTKNFLQQSRFNIYLVSTISALLLIGIIVFFVFYRNRQKNKLYKFKIKNKNKELTRFALHISERKQFLQSIKQELKKAKNQEEINKVYIRIVQNLQSDKESEDFYNEVNQFLTKFRDSLTNYNLSKKDIRLCTLIQLDLTSKDIASIFNISPKSVDMQRYRLRKKFKISTTDSIGDWLDKEIYKS